jgi:hypothetical protein
MIGGINARKKLWLMELAVLREMINAMLVKMDLFLTLLVLVILQQETAMEELQLLNKELLNAIAQD